MTRRLHAWLRQAHSDLAMAAYASQGGFHAQACYHCSQAAEKALKAMLLALDQEPERTHSIERLVLALAVARAVVGFADQQLGKLDGPQCT
ncbi:MAG: HEPN domain-containing protein [Cyanobacteriota bacterium]